MAGERKFVTEKIRRVLLKEFFMKEIKKADKSDSESDYDVRLGRDFSEDELSGDEREQM